jgi:ankyrin repeat protein
MSLEKGVAEWFRAVEMDDVAVMKRILSSSGAWITETNGRGQTALVVATACPEPRSRAVKLLLSRKAAVDAADLEGWTALHHASANGHLEIVEMLLERGANVAASTRSGSKAVHYAVRVRVADDRAPLLERVLVAMLSSRAGKELASCPNANLETPLHLAAMVGSARAIQVLLRFGVHANALTHLGETPLHYAVRSGSPAAVALLLAAGSDPALAGPAGTAADVARQMRIPEIEALLPLPAPRLGADGSAAAAALADESRLLRAGHLLERSFALSLRGLPPFATMTAAAATMTATMMMTTAATTTATTTTVGTASAPEAASSLTPELLLASSSSCLRTLSAAQQAVALSVPYCWMQRFIELRTAGMFVYDSMLSDVPLFVVPRAQLSVVVPPMRIDELALCFEVNGHLLMADSRSARAQWIEAVQKVAAGHEAPPYAWPGSDDALLLRSDLEHRVNSFKDHNVQHMARIFEVLRLPPRTDILVQQVVDGPFAAWKALLLQSESVSGSAVAALVAAHPSPAGAMAPLAVFGTVASVVQRALASAASVSDARSCQELMRFVVARLADISGLLDAHSHPLVAWLTVQVFEIVALHRVKSLLPPHEGDDDLLQCVHLAILNFTATSLSLLGGAYFAPLPLSAASSDALLVRAKELLAGARVRMAAPGVDAAEVLARAPLLPGLVAPDGNLIAPGPVRDISLRELLSTGLRARFVGGEGAISEVFPMMAWQAEQLPALCAIDLLGSSDEKWRGAWRAPCGPRLAEVVRPRPTLTAECCEVLGMFSAMRGAIRGDRADISAFHRLVQIARHHAFALGEVETLLLRPSVQRLWRSSLQLVEDTCVHLSLSEAGKLREDRALLVNVSEALRAAWSSL